MRHRSPATVSQSRKTWRVSLVAFMGLGLSFFASEQQEPEEIERLALRDALEEAGRHHRLRQDLAVLDFALWHLDGFRRGADHERAVRLAVDQPGYHRAVAFRNHVEL